MKQFTLWYENEDYQRVGDVVKIKSQTKEEAIEQFIKNHPSDLSRVKVADGFWGSEVTVDISLQAAANREAEDAEKLAEVELLKKIIIAADTPLQLSFTQLEFLIENFNLFPTLERGDEEVYSLREKLYMLSFWNTGLQSSIQTRLLSQIASVTNAAQTGSSGSGQPKWAPLAAMAALTKLDNVEKDVDDMADGFFGED